MAVDDGFDPGTIWVDRGSMTTSRSPDPHGLPLVRTPAELEAVWRQLIEPLGFASRQIFALLLDRDGVVLPSVLNVAECPAAPDGPMVVNLARSLRQALDDVDPDGSCAVLWARPSDAGTRASDIAWIRAITAAMSIQSLASWPVHTADDAVLRVMSPDDLAA
ncbi:hypothetical protein C6I20_04705 [Aeromicrobium sp. A1-2]|uniref:hypothetical protein n=1 Tax=Aeromicrobium sp. A1-2 TaxID=2107713 RepID=UPI000E52A99A|nr:hypothetical protein [Aeromicrobium sp. A1-2]AXT84566.1 hypothetical protein C6I20_04705 [Aeromicrobium sp. A1-2]